MIVCDGKIHNDGFGNEFFRLAKALVCSREFKLPFLKPHWPTIYRQGLPASLSEAQAWRDWVRRKRYDFTHKVIEFTGKNHLSTGIVPIEEAFSTFLESQGMTSTDNVLVRFPDLFPGLECIERHGKYLKKRLLENEWLAEHLRERMKNFSKRRILVGVHIRCGDFRDPLPVGEPWPANKWNIQIPLEWYVGICYKLFDIFQNNIEFLVFSNSSDDKLQRLATHLPVNILAARGHRSSIDIVDMLMLSECDIIISSCSWFSGWAIVFSDSPFIWYTCAHGQPPWKKDRTHLYVNEESLPEGLLQDARNILRTRA